MLTMIVGGILMFFTMFLNVFMMSSIVVISIMGLYSQWYGVCIKVFIAISGEKYCQINKPLWVFVYVIYVNSISVIYVNIRKCYIRK